MTIELLLALYGAGLSTYLGFKALKAARRNAEVRIIQVLTPEGMHLRVDVVGGTRPTTIVSIGLINDDEYRSWAAAKPIDKPPRYPKPELPKHLMDGQVVSISYENRPEEIWGAFAIDTSGNVYQGKMHSFPWWRVKLKVNEKVIWPFRRKRIARQKRRRAKRQAKKTPD